MIREVPAGKSRDSVKRARCRRMPKSGYSSQCFQPGVAITLSSEDVIPDRNPEEDAVVIKAVIVNKVVHWIHVDLGISVKVIYWHYFTQLGKEVQKRLSPFGTPLVDFVSRSFHPEGIITLLLTVGDHPKDILVYLEYCCQDTISLQCHHRQTSDLEIRSYCVHCAFSHEVRHPARYLNSPR